ncbi:MAG: sodium:solute symporter family protein [Bacteroidia bacterium]|nr:sodium:solute symporter family protein [Bacteroidia bacterium]
MGVQAWTFLIVGLSFALYIVIAIWTRANSTREFYVAGGGVSPLVNGMATAADWMSAASFMSMAGLISFMGRDGSIYLMGWTGGFVMLALLLAPYLRKFGKFTVPDFIGDRYYSRTARIVAVFCAIFISFTYVVGQMKGVGIAFSRFLEVDYATGVIIGMTIVFFYSVLGGMKGITYTQVAQYCVLIFAYLVPAIFISILVTGNPIPQLGFGSTTTEAFGGEYLLAKLDAIHTDLGFKEYTAGGKSTFDLFCITLALMAGTAGLPHVIIRFFTVPSVKGARKSVGYALIFIGILYTTAPAVAAFARLNMIQTISGKEYASAPDWVKNWEKTELIKFEDKNGDGVMQYLADKTTNEVTIDPDIMVLANPEIAKLPAWVVALVAAGGLAAALSTAAGLLLVISTAVSHDLLKKTFKPNITDKEELRYARIAAGVAILVSGYFGIHPPDYVAAVVAFAFGLACSSFFPAIFLGIFDKRTNTQGAVSGMLVGIIFTAGYIIYFKFINVAANTPENWWWGVSPEGIGTIGMIFNLLVTLIVSRLTPAPPADIQQMVEDIRIPRGSSSPTSGH